MNDILDFDINSLYPHQVHGIIFAKYKLFEVLDNDGDPWYQLRVYSQTIENWIISQADDRWDLAASSKKMGDGANYWIHGSLYTMMLLKWPDV